MPPSFSGRFFRDIVVTGQLRCRRHVRRKVERDVSTLPVEGVATNTVYRYRPCNRSEVTAPGDGPIAVASVPGWRTREPSACGLRVPRRQQPPVPLHRRRLPRWPRRGSVCVMSGLPQEVRDVHSGVTRTCRADYVADRYCDGSGRCDRAEDDAVLPVPDHAVPDPA